MWGADKGLRIVDVHVAMSRSPIPQTHGSWLILLQVRSWPSLPLAPEQMLTAGADRSIIAYSLGLMPAETAPLQKPPTKHFSLGCT